MMLVRAGTYLIDDTQYFPCESPDAGRTQTDTVTVDGYDYTPALNRYRNWDMFYAALRDIFTRDFLDDSYLASDGYCLFRPIDGRMYYLPTERGFAAGYNQVTTTMTFTKLEETDEKIAIRVTAVYATDDTGSQAFRQAVQDGLVSDTSTYTITMVREVGGWRFAQFEVPFLNLPSPCRLYPIFYQVYQAGVDFHVRVRVYPQSRQRGLYHRNDYRRVPYSHRTAPGQVKVMDAPKIQISQLLSEITKGAVAHPLKKKDRSKS